MTSTIQPFNRKQAHKGKGPGGGQFVSTGGGNSEKSQIAKASAVKIGAEEQRYAEEHNEPKIAKALGGESLRDNEPADIVVSEGSAIKHGVELKTLLYNKNAKITMKGEAMARKRSWARKNKARFHTLVIDDSAVFNALGKGVHDESKRKIYYRRGVGSFRVSKMYECASMDEVKKLMEMETSKLPMGAK